jgi:hypothetical protein
LFFLVQKKARIGHTEAGSKSGWLNYVSSGLQQRHQAAFAVKRHQVVTATHMGLANKNLRHCAATRDLHHVSARLWVCVDANFFYVCHSFGRQQLLGPNAIRADGRGVHLDDLHGVSPKKSDEN